VTNPNKYNVERDTMLSPGQLHALFWSITSDKRMCVDNPFCKLVRLRYCIFKPENTLKSSKITKNPTGCRPVYNPWQPEVYWKLYFLYRKLFCCLLQRYDTKELSESVHQRRTDNTRAKRKRTKGQTTIHKILHIKRTIEWHEPHWSNNCFIMP
jgi:hypothetical protein